MDPYLIYIFSMGKISYIFSYWDKVTYNYWENKRKREQSILIKA